MSGRAQLAATAAVATLGAATGLVDVFADQAWLPPVVGGIALVALVSELARRTRVAAIGPLLSAAAMLLYLTWLDARHLAYAGFIPTGSSLRALGDLARAGFTDVRSLATPVPTHKGLVLLAVVGLAAVALVVDLIAVTMRRAAVAGLPLLAVFALCTSVSRHGIGWIPFVLATSGYLWLLLADAKDRIGRWGRTLGGSEATRVAWTDIETAPSPLSVLGRRAGAAAIAIGVVVPLMIPGLRGGLPKHGGAGNGLGGSGSSRVVTINPIVSVVEDLVSRKATPVIRMTSSDPSPVYLRLTSLDHFDGTTFSPSDLSAPSSSSVRHGIKAPPVSGTGETATIAIGALAVHWLPVPVQAETVDVAGDWHYDVGSNTIFSARTTTSRLTYTVASIRNDPAASDLQAAPAVNAADFRAYLALPRLRASIRTLAESITAKATTPFAKALAIQQYLDSPPFSYSLDVQPGDSVDALERFLFQTKKGFCQQYAASMAVLARIVGIPSRVAVGFTHGNRQADGSWLVTTHDAHAWPELYFPGYGWIGFEPTPRTDGQTIQPTFAQPSNTPGATDVPPKNQQKASPQATRPRDLLKGANGATAATKATSAHQGWSGWWWLLVLLVVVATSPSLLRVIARRRRRMRLHDPAQRAGAVWAELRAVAIDAGAVWSDTVTPRTTARLLATDFGLDPAASAALGEIVSAEERARYAPVTADRDEVNGSRLWQCIGEIQRALTAEQGPAARVVRILWPRSTMQGARASAGRIADVLDALDTGVARARHVLRRRAAATISR